MLDKLRRLPLALYFLFAGTLITRMGAFVFPYLTIYLSHRGFSLDRVGLVLSVGSIGLLVGNYTGGVLTDRWSRKSTLIAALLLNAFGFAGLAWQYESPWLYALFLLIGYFGSGMYTPAANTVVADLTEEEIRPFAYTANYVCINVGMALGPLIGGFLATISYTWIFVGDVATSLVCAALIVVGVAETRSLVPAEKQDTKKLPVKLPVKPVAKRSVWLQHPAVLFFCLSYFFLIGPLMAMEFSVPLLVEREFLSRLEFVGVIYTINAICILSFSFLIERLIRSRNEYVMMIVSGIFWTGGLLILATGFSVVALMICTVVWTIGEIIASILVPTFIAKRVAPEVKGRFMSLNDIVRSFAGVVCPIGLGFVWAHQGAASVVWIIVAMPAVGTLCYFTMLIVTAHVSQRASEAPGTSPESAGVETL